MIWASVSYELQLVHLLAIIWQKMPFLSICRHIKPFDYFIGYGGPIRILNVYACFNWPLYPPLLGFD